MNWAILKYRGLVETVSLSLSQAGGGLPRGWLHPSSLRMDLPRPQWSLVMVALRLLTRCTLAWVGFCLLVEQGATVKQAWAQAWAP